MGHPPRWVTTSSRRSRRCNNERTSAARGGATSMQTKPRLAYPVPRTVLTAHGARWSYFATGSLCGTSARQAREMRVRVPPGNNPRSAPVGPVSRARRRSWRVTGLLRRAQGASHPLLWPQGSRRCTDSLLRTHVPRPARSHERHTTYDLRRAVEILRLAQGVAGSSPARRPSGRR